MPASFCLMVRPVKSEMAPPWEKPPIMIRSEGILCSRISDSTRLVRRVRDFMMPVSSWTALRSEKEVYEAA